MMARLSVARSRAVLRCRGCGKPCELMKYVPCKPSSAACWFIRSANAASLPAMCSAIATVASLPEEMTTPRSSSAMLTGRRGSIHINDEPLNTGFCDQALRLIATGSPRLTRPALISEAST